MLTSGTFPQNEVTQHYSLPISNMSCHGKRVEATAHLSKGINADFFSFLNFTEGIAISKPNLFAEEDAMNWMHRWLFPPSLLKLQSNTVFRRTVKHPAEVSEVLAVQHYRPSLAWRAHMWALPQLPGAGGTLGLGASLGPCHVSAKVSSTLLPQIKRYINTSQSHGISHIHDTYREFTCVCKHTISEYMYIWTLLSVRLLDTITSPFKLYIFTYCLPKLAFLLYGPFPFILPLSGDLKGIKSLSSSNPALKWSGTFPLTASVSFVQ